MAARAAVHHCIDSLWHDEACAWMLEAVCHRVMMSTAIKRGCCRDSTAVSSFLPVHRAQREMKCKDLLGSTWL